MLPPMAEMTKYEHGIFSWVDLSAKDMDAAATWYGELFGWTANAQDTQGGPPYTMYTLREKNVAGMGQLPEPMQAAGVPPMWNTYVTVDDVEAITAKVTAAGGKVVMPAMKIFDSGSMAVFTDPQGAAFCVWQADQHIGAQLVNEPGSFSWNELATRDVEGAKAFYGEVFGWTFKESGGAGGMPYHLIQLGDREIGGMMQLDAKLEGVPSHFMVYFTVSDLAASVEKVKATGGAVHMPPMKIAPGTFSVVADPQGAVFTMFEIA